LATNINPTRWVKHFDDQTNIVNSIGRHLIA
jgi:hypothetical protein